MRKNKRRTNEYEELIKQLGEGERVEEKGLRTKERQRFTRKERVDGFGGKKRKIRSFGGRRRRKEASSVKWSPKLELCTVQSWKLGINTN